MKHLWSRKLATLLSLLLVSAGIPAVFNAAQATALPAVANIRLIAAQKNTAVDTVDVSYWYQPDPQSPAYLKYIPAGSSVNLTYRVTDGSGAAVKDTAVTLNVNNKWAGETATWSGAGGAAGDYLATFSGTTDQFGFVSFTVTNTNNNSQAESTRVDPKAWSGSDNSRELKSGFYPTIGAATEHVDRFWPHIVQSVSASSTPGTAYIRLASELKNTATDAVDVSYWYQPDAQSPAFLKYLTVGKSAVLTYQVTDGTNPVVGKSVTLQFNNKWAGETAAWQGAGAASGDWNGTFTGTTDAFGFVSFKVTNTDTEANAESARPVANSWAEASNGKTLKSGFQPTIGSATEHVDRFWPHVVSATPSDLCPANTNAVCAPVSNITLMKGTDEVAVSYNGDTGLGSADVSARTSSLTFHYDGPAVDSGKTVEIAMFDFSAGLVPNLPVNNPAGFSSDKCHPGPAAGNHCQLSLDSNGDAHFTVTFTGSADGKSFRYMIVGAEYASKFVQVNFMNFVPTIRLVTPVIDTAVDSYDASGWDGVWQWRNARTKDYVHYFPVGGTFTLKYIVRDGEGAPMANTDVYLNLNANYSNSNATYRVIAGSPARDIPANTGFWPNGTNETRIAGRTDANGYVTWTLVNTNAAADAEATPADLKAPPAGAPFLQGNIAPTLLPPGSELSTAATEAVDVLFPHFAAGIAPQTLATTNVTKFVKQSTNVTFTFKDRTGTAISGADVVISSSGVGSVSQTSATTASDGTVTVSATSTADGSQTLTAYTVNDRGIHAIATSTVTWRPTPAVTFVGVTGGIKVTARYAEGLTIKFVLDGRRFSRAVTSSRQTFVFKATKGLHSISGSMWPLAKGAALLLVG